MPASLDSINKRIDSILLHIYEHPQGSASNHLDGYLSGLRDGNAITHEADMAARKRMEAILRERASDVRTKLAI